MFRLKNSLLPLFLLVGFSLFSAPGVHAEMTTWTNREGKDFDAELTGFKSDTKAVLLTGANRRIYRVPVRKLSFLSKLKAVGGVITLTDGEGGSVGMRLLSGLFGYAMLVYGLLIILSLAMFYFCFRTAAEWFSGGDRHFAAIVKIMLALIVFGIVLAGVGFLVGGSSFVGEMTSGGDGILPETRNGLRAGVVFLQILNLLGQLFVPMVVISSHYAIGFLRALGIWIVSSLLYFFVGLVLWLIFVGSLFIPFGNTSLGEWLFDKAILIPAGLM